MKKITLLLALLFAGITFAQNQSSGSVFSSIFNPIPQQFSGQEIFRFRPGLVTQLDAGTAFDFNSSQWFSIGKLNTGTQEVFGLRFQLKNRALTMGYQDVGDDNPRIQWIGDTTKSNLEFRSATSFTSTSSTLNATMTFDGRTFFGKPLASNEPMVGIDYSTLTGSSTKTGFIVRNNTTTGSYFTEMKAINLLSGYIKTGVDVNHKGGAYSDTGVNVNVSDAFQSTGVRARVTGSSNGSTYGVQGFIGSIVSNPTGFGAAIYGSSPTTTNRFAGYFNGNVTVTGTFTASDRKLKENIQNEENVLDKLAQLDAVTYTFKENDHLNLPSEVQHGFIAQNIEEVFPELVTTINRPIIGKDEKEAGTFEYKAVNYVGLISILTSSLNEMNEKVASLENELEALKNGNAIEKKGTVEGLEDVGFSMDQNRPNPFTSRTVINYTLPSSTEATISVFDMTGKFIRDYNISGEKGQVSINSNEIGRGMFIYSLTSNGEIKVTRKMIIK
ncbi:tail fiber domain-containing protein [Kordia jejudonensis]|uniref:tail fiber domain-containing protein n=1 Tax=Kordia jejudonensis TaxID=1348245 RepID=UPI00062910C0|nr:tail fiber domain-containing protein [Kordia jejudonensis]